MNRVNFSRNRIAKPLLSHPVNTQKKNSAGLRLVTTPHIVIILNLDRCLVLVFISWFISSAHSMHDSSAKQQSESAVAFSLGTALPVRFL